VSVDDLNPNDQLLSRLDDPTLQGTALPFIFDKPLDCIRYKDKLVGLAKRPENLNKQYSLELIESLAHCANDDIGFLPDLLISENCETVQLGLRTIEFIETFPLALIDPVDKLIRSRDESVATYACRAAGKGGQESDFVGAAKLVPTLITALERSDDIALSAAWALGQYGSHATSALNQLTRFAQRTNNPEAKHQIDLAMLLINDE